MLCTFFFTVFHRSQIMKRRVRRGSNVWLPGCFGEHWDGVEARVSGVPHHKSTFSPLNNKFTEWASIDSTTAAASSCYHCTWLLAHWPLIINLLKKGNAYIYNWHWNLKCQQLILWQEVWHCKDGGYFASFDECLGCIVQKRPHLHSTWQITLNLSHFTMYVSQSIWLSELSAVGRDCCSNCSFTSLIRSSSACSRVTSLLYQLGEKCSR